MSAEFLTQVDLEIAASTAREHDAGVRREAQQAGIALIDFGRLVDEMVEFMPGNLAGERREGYLEAVRDLFLTVNACTMTQNPKDGSISPSASIVSVPISRVDQALERRADNKSGTGTPRNRPSKQVKSSSSEGGSTVPGTTEEGGQHG